MKTKTWVIAVVGGLVMVGSVSMLVEIDARAGPYESILVPATQRVASEGHYQATGPTGSIGPFGVCIPDQPAGACSPARLDVSLRLAGLPDLGDYGSWVVSLTGPAEPTLRLGALGRADGAHQGAWSPELDGRGFDRIVVGLETDEAAGESMPVVGFERVIDDAGAGQRVDLGGEYVMRVAGGSGSVRLTEIGGFGISVTAVGELLADRLGAWTYHAWIERTDAPGEWTYLGAWEWVDAARATLDSRVASVRLEDHDRFVTVVVPPASNEVGPPSFALPGFEASFPDP